MKRFWHWLTNSEAWRVRYENGQVTYRLRWTDAAYLAELFGGEVEYDP